MDEGATPEEEASEVDSGPFCRHWGDPWDCDEMCTCGHKCQEHDRYDEGPCFAGDCACERHTAPAADL